ncbi:MAG: hypothetical protein ACW97V_20085, partial [Promethearchaeota archaeon]
IAEARLFLVTAFHASFWPGLIITGIVGSFLLFHIGLQDKAPKERTIMLIEPKVPENIDA